MSSSLITITEKTSIVKNIQATAEGVKYTLRGEWQSGTTYNLNDYVYSSRFPGFIYVATTSGTSQSETEGITSLDEPAWSILSSYIYDGALQFVPVEVTGEQANKAKVWRPMLPVVAGELVAPSTGPIIVKGNENQYFVFKLNKCITNIDWPREPRSYLQDNDITWECRVSYGKLLPAARLKEPMYKELVEIMDFLHLHEEMYFDDLTYKYADQMRIRASSAKEVIAEAGYNYITDFLGLTDKELQAALEYMSLIHYLKGSEAGLSLVFELLGVTARWEEWWEAIPIGIPDTWKLWIDVDISKAQGSLADKIINFTRQYVYPVMQEFEVTYEVNLIELGIAIGGFIDAEYSFTVSPGTVILQGIGTYMDKTYNFSLQGIVHHVIGKEDLYVGQVFGFRSLWGRIGTWGSQWIKFNYNMNNRVPIAGDAGYPKGDGYQPTDITEEEALVLITADPKRG